MAKITRRGFLKTVVISAGAASLGPSLLGCGDDPGIASEVFPLSIASGDPRADSIVLWTRVESADGSDRAVTLEVAMDEAFAERLDLGAAASLTAMEAHDHCLRVKVVGLSPGATYYYRFEHDGTVSNTGRFRTAPAADVDAPVRFALLSCQDRVGRYYNTLLRLLEPAQDDLGFVVHVGDYVYETTGDPGFMMTGDARGVGLRNPEEAIQMGTGDGAFFAASSVGNYRDLYRAYRSDPVLQRVHERFAFICTWDDHEYSDDCWGDNATYTDGALVEEDRERRRNSEQVYFEYMPVAREDEGAGALALGEAQIYPDNRLFRSFRFGQHVTLAMTDYRSFRPDHPNPEDAFPGSVVLDEAQTRAALARLEADGELPTGVTADAAFDGGGFRPYVDLEDATYADHKRALSILLTGAYAAAGVPMERAMELAATYAQGPTDAEIAQGTLSAGAAALPADLQSLEAIDPTDASLPRGLPFALTGKTSLVGQIGARYLIVQRAYDLVHAWRTRVNGDASYDDALGAQQQSWLSSVLSASDATWNLIGNSVCNTSLVLDLGPFASSLPEGLPPERFYLNGDHWDGFPERRRALMRDVYGPANAILLAGDIHAAFATDFGADGEGNRVVELTTSSVSSGTWRELLERTGNAVPSIRDSGLLEPITGGIDGFMQMAFEPLRFAYSDRNGVLFLTLDGAELRADYHLLPEALVAESFYDRPEALDEHWEVFSWRVAKDAGKNGPLTEV